MMAPGEKIEKKIGKIREEKRAELGTLGKSINSLAAHQEDILPIGHSF